MYTTHTYTHTLKRTWPQCPPSVWGCWSPIYCISLDWKDTIPYPMKPARMSNTLSFLLHFLMLQKTIRRRCAWLNRVYFVFTSLNARHRFLCTGSPGGGIVTWFLWRAFGKHLHLTFWNAYLRDGTEQWKGEIRSLLEDVCHLTVGHCCFSPMFTLDTQV